MEGNLLVDRVDGLVVATFSGQPTEQLLRKCQQQVLALVGGEGTACVLYDARAMVPPPVDLPWLQRDLDESGDGPRLRRAIVVSNTRIGFLARLAFGDGDYRVFYDDLAAATKWLAAGN